MHGIEREYGRRLNVVYVSMDEVDGVDIAHELGVIGTPTVVLLDCAGNTVNRLQGVIPEPLIHEAVQELVEEGCES